MSILNGFCVGLMFVAGVMVGQHSGWGAILFLLAWIGCGVSYFSGRSHV